MRESSNQFINAIVYLGKGAGIGIALMGFVLFATLFKPILSIIVGWIIGKELS